MIVTIESNCHKHQDEYEKHIWKNVWYAYTTYQEDNGKSHWLVIFFIPGSKEFEDFKKQSGSLWIGIDPEEDEITIQTETLKIK